MPTIYRKTAKGADEIEHRTHRLAPRARNLLIVIDGRRTDAELLQLMPQAADVLAALLEGEFIEAAARAPAPAPAPAPVAAPRASEPARASRAPDATFDTVRRELLRAFNDQVGPAGESMAIKMERARTADELRELIPVAVNVVRLVQGRAAADAFAARAAEI